jgi:hypothetical protein
MSPWATSPWAKSKGHPERSRRDFHHRKNQWTQWYQDRLQ